MENTLEHRDLSRRRQVFAGLLLGGYLTLSLSAVPSFLNQHWIYWVPLCWCALLGVIAGVLPRAGRRSPSQVRAAGLAVAGCGAGISLAIAFFVGVLLKSLAASPFDRSPLGIWTNLWLLLPAIIAREQIRGYCLAAWTPRRGGRFGIAAVLVVLFSLAEINYGKLGLLNTAQSLSIYLASDAAPIFAENILFTVLVSSAGPWAAILYAAITQIFTRTFPFLPSLPWLATSAIGVCFPILYALRVADQTRLLAQDRCLRHTERNGIYYCALGLSVLFSWFSVGVFPVYPSVVLTGSMEPMIYPGDMVLIQKAAEEEDIYALQEGDVINFKRDNITITHRILSINRDEAGNITFQTKGDNNQSPDVQLVAPGDVKGQIIKVVPKVGYPALLLSSNKTTPEGVVDGTD